MSGYLQRELAQQFVKLAQYIVTDNVRRIPQKKTYLNQRQKENKPSTIRRKGHDIPLRDAGILQQAGLYTINGRPYLYPPTPRTPNVVVLPPKSRQDVILRLRKMGYTYWGVSARSRRYAERILSVAWENAVRSR
tara:strand:+ start:220 stop:624 length:405 start_codon:yes stop_codon:yes gene_type:complete